MTGYNFNTVWTKIHKHGQYKFINTLGTYNIRLTGLPPWTSLYLYWWPHFFSFANSIWNYGVWLFCHLLLVRSPTTFIFNLCLYQKIFLLFFLFNAIGYLSLYLMMYISDDDNIFDDVDIWRNMKLFCWFFLSVCYIFEFLPFIIIIIIIII